MDYLQKKQWKVLRNCRLNGEVTMEQLYESVLENLNKGRIEKQKAIKLLQVLKEEHSVNNKDVAIIGVSGKFPLAHNVKQFWGNIINGIDCSRPFPSQRKSDLDRFLNEENITPGSVDFMDGAYFEEIDKFDYQFFGFSPKEASLMSPSQRLFLETVWEAIEDAGLASNKIVGSNTGVYLGYAGQKNTNYSELIKNTAEYNSSSIMGDLTAVLPSRISYQLDLQGPSMVIDTACSSSLVSVALACKAIRNEECNTAIASGIKLYTSPIHNEKEKLGFESSDGNTRAFDKYSDGSGIGEGIGVVIVKSLEKAVEDGDNIHAVIKGMAINQDGHSMGITAPNSAMQSNLLVKAWEDANVEPDSISYIETHGTGTNLGDPIEIQGIQNAFRKYTTKEQFCALSSAKTNIGHLFEGAGIANLIKSVMALKYRQLPPSINFNRPNDLINFVDSPVYVNTKLRPWKTDEYPRRCGVSSFGISGTNCHLVLEEAPQRQKSSLLKNDDWYLFTISANTKDGLMQLVEEYRQLLATKETTFNLSDLCYTVNTGRDHYCHRIVVKVKSMNELQHKLHQINLKDFNDSNTFYGHHILSTSHTNSQHILNEEEQEKLNKQADRIMKGITQSRNDESLLTELCNLYIKGAVINWNELHDNKKQQIVSLPTYPFKRTRCWIDDYVEKDNRSINNMFHTVKWKKSELIYHPREETREGAVLIFSNDNKNTNQIVQHFNNKNRNVIMVQQGDSFNQINDNTFTVSETEEDYNQLFADIKDRGISQIIHLFTDHVARVNDLTQMNNDQEIGFYSLYRATRAIIHNNIREDLDVVLISRQVNEITGKEEYLQPQYASLFGIGKTVFQEYPNIKCRSIDLDTDTSFENIIAELNQREPNYLVAYRNNQRYVEEFAKEDIQSFDFQQIDYRSNGVYIITGGLGGVGLEISKYLSNKAAINIALINRSPLPPRNEWESILKESNNKDLKHKIESIKQMEATGATVYTYSANVSNQTEMEDLICQLRTKFGSINGIVHMAAVVGNGYIVRRDKEQMDQVIHPKVQGTLILDELTKQDELDFFILFSSGIAMLGEAGHADYVAANTFLDAYAAYRNKKGRPTVTIDWVAWKNAGTAVTYGFNEDKLFKATPTKQATKAFEEAMNRKVGRVLIGELNPNGGEHTLLLEELRIDLSPEIKSFLREVKNQLKDTDGTNEKGNQQELKNDVHLTGKNNEPYSTTEQKIANIYRDILGFSEINVFTSFFELGGDSLMIKRLHAELENNFPGKVNTADLFAYTTVSKLANFIDYSDHSAYDEKTFKNKPNLNDDDDIAIIGMSLNMPMAENIEEYWKNIRSGVECVRKVPDHRRQDMNNYLSFSEGLSEEEIKYHSGSYLEDVDKFDYDFFNITPKEAKLTDPHQRLFLQNVWHAIEDAGYGDGKLKGTNTGVYMGFANHLRDSYLKMVMEVDPDLVPLSVVGNVSSMMPTRISYILNLTGPTMVIDTACSSSLVSVHQACQAIKKGDCEMAIASGVRVTMMPVDRDYMKVGIESSTDRTMTFDTKADGSGLGEGAGTVILKPLKQAIADGDQVHSVIKGSAINQDGSSMSITAPNPEAQVRVLEKAWNDAGVDPETLSFIEAHGTATSLGDPIEIEGLNKSLARYTDKKQFCAIGSVKSNIGHLFEGAGIASLIKSILALKNSEIPPSINFDRPNTNISFEDSPVYVNTKLRKWKSHSDNEMMRGGVSSFGFSGTNCHIVLEQSPTMVRNIKEEADLHVLTVSARDKAALEKLLDQYIDFIEEQDTINIPDLCFTTNTGRDHFRHRIALIVKQGDNLVEKLIQIKHQLEDDYNDSPNKVQNEEVQDKLIRFCESGKKDKKLLEEVCEQYVLGADLDWHIMYQTSNARRISLPVYPFSKKRCWIDIPVNVTKKINNSINDSDKHFTMKWKEEKLHDRARFKDHGSVIIFKDDRNIGSQISKSYKDNGLSVIEVSFGNKFAKNKAGYTITGSEEDYKTILQENKNDISKIIHLSSIKTNQYKNHLKDLEDSLRKGVHSLFYLTRCIVNEGISRWIDIVLISDYVNKVSGNEDEIKPENATLFGLGKVVRRENSNLSCRAIDIDNNTTPDELMKEIAADTDVYQSSYRNQSRYVEVFSEVDLEEAKDSNITIQENGTFLITGGTGGIGLEMAKFLARTKPVNFALVSRTEIPVRNKWGEILEDGTDKRLCTILNELMVIEELGSTVTCYSADVTKPKEMKKVVKEVREKHQEINGVIHGAGLPGLQAIKEQKLEDFNSIMMPKVQGALILDQLTRQDNLDFFVMFSSIATYFSASNQGDYVAGNSYLDSFSSYRNQLGHKTLTINWPTWKETGMAARQNFTADTIFKAIETKKALNAFQEALGKDVSNVLVGEINYEGPMVTLLDKHMFALSSKIRRNLDYYLNRSSASRLNESQSSSNITLSGKEEGEYQEIQQALARICNEILGFNEINVNDNFFELGADSITLTKMQEKIDIKFPGIVEVTDIFERTSIGKLAEFIGEKMEPINKPNDSDIKASQDENMDDKLSELFDGVSNKAISASEALKNIKDM